MFYVYEWFIKDTNEVFYVGKGSKKRYSSKKKGNDGFYEILNNNDCDYRIVKEFKCELEAFEYEHIRINELKSIGQAKCNHYKGGFGGLSSVWTDEMKNEKSINNPMKRPDMKQRMSINNPMKNKEIAEKNNAKKRKAIVIDGIEFESLAAAAEHFKVTNSAVLAWLQKGHKNKVPCNYKGKEPVKYEYKEEKSYYKPIYINGIRYISIKAAAKALNIKYTTLHASIKFKRKIEGIEYSYDYQKPSSGNQ